MYAWKTTEDDIRAAAAEVGLRAVGIARAGKTDRAPLTFALALDTSSRRPDGFLPYQRLAMLPNRDGTHRRLGAVCWHGHRDFMRALFRRSPDMRLKSALADYRGARDFEQTHTATRGATNGWNVVLNYGEACVCEEVAAVA